MATVMATKATSEQAIKAPDSSAMAASQALMVSNQAVMATVAWTVLACYLKVILEELGLASNRAMLAVSARKDLPMVLVWEQYHRMVCFEELPVPMASQEQQVVA